MAPELKLGVGLDLVYFRQQMRKAVNIAQSEFTAQLQVKFNRQVLNKEIRNLDRAIKRKKFNVELNLVGGLTGRQFDQIQARLDALAKRDAVEIPVSIRAAATGRDVQLTVAQLRRKFNENQQVAQGGGKLRFPVSIKSGITNADVTQFRRDVEGKLKGIKVKVKAEVGEVSRGAAFAAGPTGAAGLYEFMRTQGLSGGNMPGQTPTGAGRRARFQNAVEQATSKELQQMLTTAKVAGRSKLKTKAAMQKKLLELDDIAMESILGNLKMQMQEPRKIKRSFLDQIARAVMYMAGVDPEVLRQQAAARRLPPAIDFPATVPSRTIPIGPSATGRALTGVSQAALPGQSIAAAKYLPSDLGVELKNILRAAAYVFVDSLNQRIRQVSVREIGQAQLAPSRVAGLLPSAVGRQAARYGGPGDVRGRRIAEAYKRSAARSASVMAEGPQGFALGAGGSGPAGPFRQYAQPPRGGAIVPFQPSMAGGGGRGGRRARGGIGQMAGQAKRLASSLAPLQQGRLPLTGAVSELTGEFGNAIKQVLLFGTAYKALAFITDLPNQAFQAAKSLDSFENQLRAITNNTPAFEQSLQFINDTVAKFNVPLESARTGFARLYASMNPAGIDDSTIQGLFTGISQAAATLSLTPDQVDRVTYAFSQMASKGKIMSEEVTGQLGDVIPGALSLMADAAGMSMADFKKAMEDGQLSGKAMEQVFSNLGIVFDERFGKGAEGAAKTLQGMTNSINNAMKEMYEALAPIVDEFAAAFGPEIQRLIKDVTDVFTVLSGNFSDTADAAEALSPRARAIYDAIQQLAPAVREAASSVASLGQFFAQLTPLIVSTVSAALNFLNTGLGRGLVIFGVAIGGVTAAFKLLVSTGIAPTIAAIYKFIAAMAAAQIRSFTGLIFGLTKGMLGLQKAFVVARSAAIIFTGALTGIATLGIGLVIAGIANALLGVGDNARQAASDVAQLKKQLDGIAGAGDVAAAQAVLTTKQGVEQSANLILAARRRELKEAKQRKGSTAGVGVALAEQNLLKAETAYEKAVDERVAAENTVRNAERVAGERATAMLPPRTKVELQGKDKGKGKELQPYDPDLKLQYDLALKQAQKAIENDVSLTKRQKEILMAKEKVKYDELVAIDQYNRDLEKANKVTTGTRAKAVQDAKRNLEDRKKLAYAEFTTTMGAPLIAFGEDLAQRTEDLRKKEQLLKSGKKELTAVQVFNNLVQQQANDLGADYIAQMQPTIDFIRRAAAAYDARNESLERSNELEKQRKKFEETQAGLQGRLAMAGAITPGQEIRERLRQEGFAPEQVEQLAQLEELAIKAEEIKAIYQNVAQTIGSAFGQAFQDVVNGSKGMQEALSDMLQSIGESFVAMAAEIIAKQVAMITLQAILKALGGPSFGGGGGGGGGGLPVSGGDVSSFNTTGFGNLSPQAFPVIGSANGNVLKGGFQAFANGGVVKGPTLGLVGEGRYNEAVVPLPDGRSIPVQFGGRSARDVMGKGAPGMPSPSVLNMSFETTNIGGVEYVSRDQLELAMAQTRRDAAKDGASRGSQLALNKLQNSPATRRQIGLR